MSDPFIAFWALVSKVLAAVLPATLGALVSLKFLPDGLTKFQRALSVVCAWAIGTYFGRGAAAYFNITNDHMTDAILFGFSLFGLSFVGTALGEMKPVLQAMRKRWIGVGDSGEQN